MAIKTRNMETEGFRRTATMCNFNESDILLTEYERDQDFMSDIF